MAGLVLALACAAALAVPNVRSRLERLHDVVGSTARSTSSRAGEGLPVVRRLP